jgi:alkaline phosphatase D
MKTPRAFVSCILAVLYVPLLAFAAADDKPLTRIAFGSCLHQGRPQPIWDALLETKPELFLFLGDNIYSDTTDMKKKRAQYDRLLTNENFKKLQQTCPILATWDDHDYGINDMGAEYPAKKESQQLFLDVWNVPADSPRRQQEGIYYAQTFGPEGKRVQVILLDTRYFRSPLKREKKPEGIMGPYDPTDDTTTTFLGEAQWKWLEAQLKQPADLRLLCSSVQCLAEFTGWESWANFPHERARLFKLLRDTKSNAVVILSGDTHWAELSLVKDALPYPLYELTSSALNQSYEKVSPNKHRVGNPHYTDNFGLVLIDWDNDKSITLQIRDTKGKIQIEQNIPLKSLKP